jgi:site-specific DNA-methyltransferase (adenine-specific)
MARMKTLRPRQAPTKTTIPEHRVRVQDCVEGMAELEAASVDICITSPPYNIRTNYKTYMDAMEQEEYLAWCVKWVRAVRRVLKDDGSFFLNLGNAPSNPTIPHELLHKIIEDGQFKLQNTIHWIKAITVVNDKGEELSKGHFKPVPGNRFLNDCHEHIFHLTPKGNTPLDRRAIGVKYKHKSNIKRWQHANGNDLRCRGNTWFIPYRTIHNRDEDRPHPATFPPELPERCIKLHGARNDVIVMDCFLGSGTTWIAAIKCKVGKFIGFDIDREYVQMARRRVAELLSENNSRPIESARRLVKTAAGT